MKQIAPQRLVHLVDAGFDGFDQSAAADDGRERTEPDARLVERSEHEVPAKGKLFGHR
ncbi:MAG: hypothetical protein ACLT1W_12580 [Alistipes onderdonkii]